MGPWEAKKSKKRPPEIYTRAEMETILNACSKRGSSGIRNRSLISLAYRCGLRLQEALDLLPRDIDFEEQTVRVRHGKNDRSRIVGVDYGTLALLSLWLNVRNGLGIGKRAPVFCTLKGDSIDQSYVRHMLKRLERKIGFQKRIHFHGFRHSFSYESMKEGSSIPEISGNLGHASLAYTFTYLNHIAPIERIDRNKNREWDIGSVLSRKERESQPV